MPKILHTEEDRKVVFSFRIKKSDLDYLRELSKRQNRSVGVILERIINVFNER